MTNFFNDTSDFDHKCQQDYVAHRALDLRIFYENAAQHKINSMLEDVIDSLPTRLRHSELMIKYIAVITNSLDIFVNKSGKGYGLVTLQPEAIQAYENIYQFSFKSQDFEACAGYLSENSPYFGLGCTTTRQYQSLLKTKKPKKDMFNCDRILKIQSRIGSGRLLTKNMLPKGPLDRACFSVFGGEL